MKRAQPDALDPFELDSQLSDEHALIRDTVRRFVDAEICPRVGAWFRDELFPENIIPELGRHGLLGLTISGWGCAGLDPLAYGLVCRELERADSAFRSFVSVQTSLVMGAIARFGSAEQKSRYLPALASGELVGCFGLTESHGGSDPANMKTRATSHAGVWRLSGSKQWITNAGIADVAVIWARTDEDVGAFLVEKGARGFEQRTIKGKLSLRASNTGELFLNDVACPEAQRLPEAVGLKAAFGCLDEARFGIVWGAVGAAQSCIEEVIAYVKDRRLFGAPLARKQLVQARLADAVRQLGSAQLLAWRLAELKQAGRAAPTQIALGKWNNVRAALGIARTCRDLLGAAGITTEHRAMRHMLNLESVATYEGTEAIHTLVVGRAITGESAF